jgi:hypothetical protein
LAQVYWQDADFDLLYGCCSVVRGEQWDRYGCEDLYPAGRNGSRYCNPEFDALVASGLAETDPEKQRETWYEVSKIFAEELPSCQSIRRSASWPAERSCATSPGARRMVVWVGLKDMSTGGT